MLRQWLFLYLLSLSGVVFADGRAQEKEGLAVVELFTSQGCYSCPPADEFLGELAERENIIALSCHVTYWNYIGWKDTFSRRFCDDRQRQYQSVLLDGRRGVYTPQMVVNGRYAGVGSRRHVIESIVAFDQKNNRSPLLIDLRISGDQLIIEMPPQAESTSIPPISHLFLLGTSGEHLLSIGRGENAGKKLSYHHPVEYAKSLGFVGKQQQAMTVSLPQQEKVTDWIVIAQHKHLGEITAVGRLSVE